MAFEHLFSQHSIKNSSNLAPACGFLPTNTGSNISPPEIYTAMCRHLIKTYGCGHKLRTTSPTSSLCAGMNPKVHPSGSEFSYRKFEQDQSPCPACTASEEHGRQCRAEAAQARNREVAGARGIGATVSRGCNSLVI